jgi:hypothetical protein
LGGEEWPERAQTSASFGGSGVTASASFTLAFSRGGGLRSRAVLEVEEIFQWREEG